MLPSYFEKRNTNKILNNNLPALRVINYENENNKGKTGINLYKKKIDQSYPKCKIPVILDGHSYFCSDSATVLSN